MSNSFANDLDRSSNEHFSSLCSIPLNPIPICFSLWDHLIEERPTRLSSAVRYEPGVLSAVRVNQLHFMQYLPSIPVVLDCICIRVFPRWENENALLPRRQLRPPFKAHGFPQHLPTEQRRHKNSTKIEVGQCLMSAQKSAEIPRFNDRSGSQLIRLEMKVRHLPTPSVSRESLS